MIKSAEGSDIMNQEELNEIYDKLKSLNHQELRELVVKLLTENEQLKQDILIDNLTKTYNRNALSKNVKYDVLAMCDIDDFKTINDTYGHQAGDDLLVAVAKNLSKILRSDDKLIRYGGDEFTILFKNCSIEDIKRKLDRIKEGYFQNNQINIKITMSFGITEYIEGKDLEEAISEADHALYRSKKKGKNAVTIYEKDKNNSLIKTII